MDLSINTLTVGNWKVNCYFISVGDSGWLIDPGDEYEKVIEYFKISQINLKGILTTHGHFDHIGAVADIKLLFNVNYLTHSKDARLISQSNLYRKMSGDSSIRNTPVIDKYLDDLPFLEFNNQRIYIYHTPGHTNGSVCFGINGNLFTGDLFFEKKTGRTDLPGGNADALSVSIDYIISNFKGFRIYPGHGKSFILDPDLIKNLNIIN